MLKKLKFTFTALLLCLTTLTGVLVGCADDIRLSAAKTELEPGESVQLECSVSDAVFVVNEGRQAAEIGKNGVLTVAGDAAVGTIIKLTASFGKNFSNELKLSVKHKEATAVELIVNNAYIFIGTTLTLSGRKIPANATRPLEYKVTEGPALVKDGKLTLTSAAKADDIITVKAYCGEVESEPKTLTVGEYSSEKAFITFDNDMNENNTIVYDSSLAGPPLQLVVRAFVNRDGQMVPVTDQLTFRVDETTADAVKLQGGAVTALRHGVAKVWACHEPTNSEEYVLIDIRKPPIYIGSPQGWKNKVESFYSGLSQELSGFRPSYNESDGGSRDYRLTAAKDGVVVGAYDSTLKRPVDNGDIAIDGDKISFKNTGVYTLTFSSLADCKNEAVGRPLTFTVNKGTNVADAKELLRLLGTDEQRVVNIICNLALAGGTDSVTAKGDRELYGNGFTVDLSRQTFAKDAYSSTDFLTFTSYGKEYEHSYKVTVRDINLIGNYGNMSLNQIGDKGGVDADDLLPPKVSDGSSDYAHLMQNFAYKAAIRLTAEGCENEERDGTRKFATATADFSGVRIQGFGIGIVFEQVYDKAADGDGEAALRNVTVSNLFGDGIVCERSIFKLEDISVSNIGGAPFVGNGESNSDWAGETRTRNCKLVYGEGIECDNPTRGDSPYFLGQFLRLGGMGSAMLSNGISGVMSPLMTLMRQNIVNNYFIDKPTDEEKKQLKQKVDASMSCIIEDATTKFNLLHYSSLPHMDIDTSGMRDYRGGSAVMVDYEFFVKGMDTTHKYLVIKVGTTFEEILSEINNFLGFDLDTFVFIIVNRNYAANV